jgi:hypothetical protein
MRKVWLAFLMGGLMALWSAPASASPVSLSNNGTPDYKNICFSDTANNIFEAYDYFTLGSASKITGIEWWGVYYGANTPPKGGNLFEYEIQSNPGSNGQPNGEYDSDSGSLGSGSPVNTGSHSFAIGGSYNVYEFNATTSISLPAGSYFLTIYGTVSDPGNMYGWATSEETQTDEWSYSPAFHFWDGPSDAGLAFNLTGNYETASTPEPVSLIFFGTGLVAVGGYVARRRSR